MTLRLLTDEDFDGRIIQGLRLRSPDIDLVRAVDIRLNRTPDDEILVWAAEHDRVVVSHDVTTMGPAAYRRLAEGQSMPGLILVPQWLAVGRAIDDLLRIVNAHSGDTLVQRVQYIPL
jgi:hypothetical protein